MIGPFALFLDGAQLVKLLTDEHRTPKEACANLKVCPSAAVYAGDDIHEIDATVAEIRDSDTRL